MRAKSDASICRRHRRTTSAMVPDFWRPTEADVGKPSEAGQAPQPRLPIPKCQTFLHRRQDGLVLVAFAEDYAGGMQAGLGDSREKQVKPRQAS
jgi:hypothetical protein